MREDTRGTKKMFAFDVETTGKTAGFHEITQLAYAIVIDGEPKLTRSLLLRPLKPENIDPEAMAVQGRTREEVAEYAHPHQAYVILIGDFAQFIDKYNSQDKLIPLAFNAPFDLGFLGSLFDDMADKYLGSWIDRKRTLDPLPMLRWLDYWGAIKLADYKLSTVAGALGIPVERAHDALSDINVLLSIEQRLTLTYILHPWTAICPAIPDGFPGNQPPWEPDELSKLGESLKL